MPENIWLTKQVKTFDFSLQFRIYAHAKETIPLKATYWSVLSCVPVCYAVEGGVSFRVLRNTSLIVTFKIRLIYLYY